MERKSRMMLSTILMSLSTLVVLGGLATWGYRNHWGPYPRGGLGLIVVVLVVLVLTHQI